MDKEFKNKLSQNLHLHFGYFYDQNGKKIKPDEIVTWFEKQEQPIKSVEAAIGFAEWIRTERYIYEERLGKYVAVWNNHSTHTTKELYKKYLQQLKQK